MSKCADCVFWKESGDGFFACSGCAVWDLIHLESSIPDDLTRGYEESRCAHFKDRSRRAHKQLMCGDCSHWTVGADTFTRDYGCDCWERVEAMLERIDDIEGYFGGLKYGFGYDKEVVCPYFN